MTTVNSTPYSVQDLATASIENGNFIISVKGEDGATSKISLTFSQLLLSMGLHSLGITRSTFDTQFAIAQERVNAMKDLNDLVQSMNLYKDHFKADGKVTDDVKKRNDALYKDLLGAMETVTKDGKTYAKGTDGGLVGPLEFVTRGGDNKAKVDKTFNQLLSNPDAFRCMTNEAKLFLLLTDGVSAERYRELSIKVKAYHDWNSGTGDKPEYGNNAWYIPKTGELSPPLTGDDLAFMKKMSPLLQEAKDKEYGIISWNSETQNRYYNVSSEKKAVNKTAEDGTVTKEDKWFVGTSFALANEGDAAFVKSQRETYEKLLTTPMAPSGLTMLQIAEITEKISGNKSDTSYMSGADLQKLTDFMAKYPNTLNVDPEKSRTFTQKELETFLSNCQTAQSTLSSLNDQQGTRTNQAMQRSSGMLQTLQTMLQAANQAKNSAASTGG